MCPQFIGSKIISGVCLSTAANESGCDGLGAGISGESASNLSIKVEEVEEEDQDCKIVLTSVSGATTAETFSRKYHSAG